jgi:hypothetical protein
VADMKLKIVLSKTEILHRLISAIDQYFEGNVPATEPMFWSRYVLDTLKVMSGLDRPLFEFTLTDELLDEAFYLYKELK